MFILDLRLGFQVPQLGQGSRGGVPQISRTTPTESSPGQTDTVVLCSAVELPGTTPSPLERRNQFIGQLGTLLGVTLPTTNTTTYTPLTLQEANFSREIISIYSDYLEGTEGLGNVQEERNRAQRIIDVHQRLLTQGRARTLTPVEAAREAASRSANPQAHILADSIGYYDQLHRTNEQMLESFRELLRPGI